MPVSKSTQAPTTSLSDNIAAMPARHDNKYPLWQGPCASGPLGGITQSMLVRFLSCRERFRLKYVLGLEPPDRWVKTIGYGNMWHVCEEHHAKIPVQAQVDPSWLFYLRGHVLEMSKQYPMQGDEINKWYQVCQVQFPEYVKYWSEHPDVLNRTPLMQEQVFDVPYQLPSGRTVRLRGKFDSVDLIDGGVWLQENKSKGDIDKAQVERQLKFDLQTMLYLVAMHEQEDDSFEAVMNGGWDIKGVRYNVVRRPLSGGIGSIKPHAAKFTKNTAKPAETNDEFYERLRRDYIADDPAYWFFRVRTEVSANDIKVFKETCLTPLLETVCDWYDWMCCNDPSGPTIFATATGLNYRTPFGIYNPLTDGGGETEYDAFLETGSMAGLRQVDSLFGELQ